VLLLEAAAFGMYNMFGLQDDSGIRIGGALVEPHQTALYRRTDTSQLASE
jgi:hypothetical protein